MMEKTRYNFYLSYWESYKALSTNAEKVEFMDVINKIHFFEEHIDRIVIKNANVKLLFASIKHSLKSSIQGYCDKKSIDYDSLFTDPYQGGTEGGSEPPCEQLVIGKEQIVIDNKKHAHGEFKKVLLTDKEYSKLADLYKNKLDKAIDLLDTYVASKKTSYTSHYVVMVKSNGWVYKEVMGGGVKSYSENGFS